MGKEKAACVCRSKIVKKTDGRKPNRRGHNKKKTLVNMLVSQPKKKGYVGVSDDVEVEQLQCRKSLGGPFQGRDHGIVENVCRQSQLLDVISNKAGVDFQEYEAHHILKT